MPVVGFVGAFRCSLACPRGCVGVVMGVVLLALVGWWWVAAGDLQADCSRSPLLAPCASVVGAGLVAPGSPALSTVGVHRFGVRELPRVD